MSWAAVAGRLPRLPWPLPALLAWAAGWACWLAAQGAGAGRPLAWGLALLVSTSVSLRCAGRWRQGIAAAGFPLSAWALDLAVGLPPWLWLALLFPVLALYPLRAWRDAPFFPTPTHALAGLDAIVGQPQQVLDAGCGLGHGLAALRRLWPRARLSGVEWSPLLAALARRRCPDAQVCRGDMWATSWAGFDLVYLFQRPESMARAHAKAGREMAAGAWLVSLEFAVPGEAAAACLQGPGRRTVWIYRLGALPPPSIIAGSGR